MIADRTRLLAVLLILVAATLVRAADDGPSILSVRSGLPARTGPSAGTGAKTVGLYEKLELHVDLKATYTNPFDPDQIDLWAEFTAPSGKPWRI